MSFIVRSPKWFKLLFLIALIGISWGEIVHYLRSRSQPVYIPPPEFSDQPTIHFAIIGDFGLAGEDVAAVAELVTSWDPDFIVSTGDNNYPNGQACLIDENIGQYYHAYIGGYTGKFGSGADQNRFFPALGNHDWYSMICLFSYCRGAHLDYFDLPGNERYYDFVWGPVHFFVLDSVGKEPDGTTKDSLQARWLQTQIKNSKTPWNLVVFHYPPYSSSSRHGSYEQLQWPFREWGASAIISGHDHAYERLVIDGLPYFVNGLGGKTRYDFGTPLPGSQVRFNQDFGAMQIEANQQQITFKFITIAGVTIDSYTLEKTSK